MHLFRRFAILLLAFLGACALFRKDPARPVNEVTTAFQNEAATNTRLDPIRGKVSLVDPKEATPSMLALSTFPTAEEKRALQEWQGMSRFWQLKLNPQLPKTSAWMVPILEADRAASLTLLGRLHGASINYGQFNKSRVEFASKKDETIEARAEELNSRRPPSPAASTALSAFRAYLIEQRLVNQQMQPIPAAPFTCTRLGNQARCF